VFSLAYMILLRLCAKVIIWVTFIATVAFIIIIGILLFSKSGSGEVDDGNKLTYKVFAIICWSVALIILLIVFCICEDVQLGIAIIEAAATFTFSNCVVILVPIVMIIVTCSYIVYWLVCTLYIYSIGNITQYGRTPFPSIEWESSTTNLWYYQLLALVWIVAFLLAIEQFTIAATTVQWYFSSSSDQGGTGSVCKSIWWAIRYHLGSLAFGSFIVTIVTLIRFIFEYMRKKVEKRGATNRFTKCLLACASCCLKCIGQFVLWITKNAYVQVAIRSVCFCSAARHAFRLVLRNVARFTIVNVFVGVFTLFGKLLVGLANAFLCWFILNNWTEMKENIYSPLMPTIGCFVIGYIVADVLLSTYDLSAAAVLQSFLIDEETDGVRGKNRPASLEGFISNLRQSTSGYEKI